MNTHGFNKDEIASFLNGAHPAWSKQQILQLLEAQQLEKIPISGESDITKFEDIVREISRGMSEQPEEKA